MEKRFRATQGIQVRVRDAGRGPQRGEIDPAQPDPGARRCPLPPKRPRPPATASWASVAGTRPSQLIFMDTPGIHKATSASTSESWMRPSSAMGDVDLILFMVRSEHPDPDAEGYRRWRSWQKQPRPVVLALNKTDQVPAEPPFRPSTGRGQCTRSGRRPHIRQSTGARSRTPLSKRWRHVFPEGPALFPEDTLTDMPERFIAAEMIREKVFRLTGQEIPYATAVTVESFEEKERMVSIHATIHVERSSQKAIVIGKGGSKLKQIGQAAREDMERMLGTQVFLRLFVRVQKNWSRDTRALRKFGY